MIPFNKLLLGPVFFCLVGMGWHWEGGTFDFHGCFEAIFGMDLLHSTLPNGLQAFRLSCDTRWQPLDEAPPQGVQTGPWRAFRQGTLPEGRRSGKGRMSKKMDDQENLVGGFNEFLFSPRSLGN